ncbi:YihY/virulence factor BrkB family protein [Salipiger pallidus]|nr:YihY/virulence factor BrkB family protein [Salipiger pallidus]
MLRVKAELVADRISLVSAGVAFYALMAIFPAITALMAIAGLFITPADVTAQIQQVTELLPQRAAEILIEQAKSVAGSQSGGLGLAAALGILLALYSASAGVAHLIEGLNVAYDEKEKRGFIRLKLTTLALTLLLIVGLLLAIGALLVLPGILAIFELGPVFEAVVSWVRWGVLLLLVVAGIALIYRFGPSRKSAEWAWIAPGALVACLLWLMGSVAFSLYAEHFGSYQETFGSLAGVIILLFWLWISAYVILLGAEINAEMEAQTTHDTTTGKDMPRGTRGAVKADAFKGNDAP